MPRPPNWPHALLCLFRGPWEPKGKEENPSAPEELSMAACSQKVTLWLRQVPLLRPMTWVDAPQDLRVAKTPIIYWLSKGHSPPPKYFPELVERGWVPENHRPTGTTTMAGDGSPCGSLDFGRKPRVQLDRGILQRKRHGRSWHQKARLSGAQASPISYLNMSFEKEGVYPTEWDSRDWVYQHLLMTFLITGWFLFYCH